MDYKQVINSAAQEFEKTLNHLKEEYTKLQIGRASAALVEGVTIDAYGSSQPLKAVASVSIPDARTIQIQPWDKSMLGPIEKGIQVANLGLNPVNDGIVVRINIPALTEERRKDLIKVVKKMAEDAKIAVRNSRQDAHNAIKKMKADSILTEDDLHVAEKELQNKVDDINKKIDETMSGKEKDVMTV